MSELELQPQAAKEQDYDVLIVGGGVAGLYAALRLGQARKRVAIVEGSNRWGGRIETLDMDGFLAEYGPMRFEKYGQPQLTQLLAELGLTTHRFPAYRAAEPQYPIYNLRPDEQTWSTLDLLRIGILRTLALSPGDPGNPNDPRNVAWWGGLTEDDYAHLRRTARQGNRPEGELLHRRGFWNALEDVLSHPAVTKIRDLGTFYHLIPENPNAIEWIIFWLRGLKPGDELVGIDGGSRRITEGLLAKLDELVRQGVPIRCELGMTVLGLRPEFGGVVATIRHSGGALELKARHVLLGLPTSPLKKLATAFPPEIRADLNAVIPFPLLKCFFVVDDPWWNAQTPPQTKAELTPTREIHYSYKPAQGGRPPRGMVMLYTDRPATEYWKLYVVGAVHDRPEIDRNPLLAAQFFRYLAREIQAAAVRAKTRAGGLLEASPALATADFLAQAAELSEDELAQKLAERVTTYGIRDWAREPYGAACHAWGPAARSWEVMDRLKAFPLAGETVKNVHICGEAYSDYQGFIEGALRTTNSALAEILR